jgi:hypothetical protein
VVRQVPVREFLRLDVPASGNVFDVLGVVPVAEAGIVAVAAGLARVLGGRLAVHPEDGAARLAYHAAD